jgi:hypothetical protein
MINRVKEYQNETSVTNMETKPEMLKSMEILEKLKYIPRKH